jgi:hypothetical protein
VSNLELWDSVSKTDPRYTKKAKKGMHQFTSITPIYQVKKATAALGVQGIGWGIDPRSEVFSEREYGTTIILNYDAVLYFIVDGKRGEIGIHASEKACYQTQGANGYMKIDDEVRKKVVTNAKTKGLSELGFSADVFMGEFDNPNYVDARNFEESIEKAENRSDEISKKTLELNEWCKEQVACYSSIPAKATLDLIYKQHKEKLHGRCVAVGVEPVKYLKAFDNAYTKQIEAIKEKKNATTV